ncbi:hypothetical protein MTR_3g077580 [Medicago truncatula]|uniref:Uncharacterized protein n=1 Tax=Medicago truncatula TaxID=3880 RepID=G7J5D9_MEDTR|nr:hypothetical protein MTR_3g077580 [Medicago truncatula]
MAKRLIPTFNCILAEKIVPPSKTSAGVLLPEKTSQLKYLVKKKVGCFCERCDFELQWKRNEGGCWLWEMEPGGRRPQSWEQDDKSLESEAIEIRCGRT